MEHARTYLDAPGVVTPPPAYDPSVVAKAMLFAAENPKRELTVGFGGWAIAALGTVAPRLTDYAMELTGFSSQTTDDPGRRERRDNLYEAEGGRGRALLAARRLAQAELLPRSPDAPGRDLSRARRLRPGSRSARAPEAAGDAPGRRPDAAL
jgi:hypothetical protein